MRAAVCRSVEARSARPAEKQPVVRSCVLLLDLVELLPTAVRTLSAVGYRLRTACISIAIGIAGMQRLRVPRSCTGSPPAGTPYVLVPT